MERRIGVDLDQHNGLLLLVAYLRHRRVAEDTEVSYTEHGFHLDGPARDGTADLIRTRRLCRDDNRRLDFDVARMGVGLGGWVDTLFEWKDGGSGWYHTRRFDPLTSVAEPVERRPVWL